MLKHLRGFMRVIMVGVIVTSLCFLYLSSQRGPRRTPDRSGRRRPVKSAGASAELPAAARALKPKQILMTHVKYPVRDPETDRKTADVWGKTAILDTENKNYLITFPLIESWIKSGQGSGGLSGKVTVSAERCTLMRPKGEAILKGKVVVTGENFVIMTDEVTYHLIPRTLNTQAHVVLHWFESKDADRSKPSIIITGTGLEGDLIAQRVKILTKPVVTIREASGRFFADSGGFKPNDNTQPAKAADKKAPAPTPVVIRAAGTLTYEHLTNIATFRDKVTVTSGEKKLYCDKLVIQFQTKERGITIKQVDAFDHARLEFQDRRADADHIQWRRVTQTTVLNSTGEKPVLIRQGDFSVSGKRIFFYQMDRRVDVDNSGELVKTFPAKPAAAGAAAVRPRKLVIKWKDSMSYDASDRRAVFLGDVELTHDRTTLTAQELEFTVSPSDHSVEDFSARKNVLVVMHGAGKDGGEMRAYGQDLRWKAAPADKKAPKVKGGREDDLAAVAGVFRLVGSDKAPARLENGPHWIKTKSITYDQVADKFVADSAGELHGIVSDDPSQPFPEVINVTWSKRMTYVNAGNVRADFFGDVKARRKGQNITCDHLTVVFTPAKPQPKEGTKMSREPKSAGEVALAKQYGRKLEVDHIEAEGNVQLTQTPVSNAVAAKEKEGVAKTVGAAAEAAGAKDLWVILTKSLKLFPRQSRMLCDAAGYLQLQKLDEPEGVWLKITWRDKMSFDATKGEAKFAGKTVSSFSETILAADKLRVFFDDSQMLRRIVGTGNVKFTRPLSREGKEPTTTTVTCKEIQASFGSSREARRYLKQATALDDVVVDDPEYQLLCRRLDTYMVLRKPAGGGKKIDMDIDRAVAVGKKVVIIQKIDEKVKATGNRLVWERNPEKRIDRYVLTGDDAELLKQGISMTHKMIIVDRIKNVVTTQGGLGKIDYEPGKEAPK